MEQFKILRNSLEPILDSWEATLADAWRQIRKNPEKDKRLAVIIEYNNFFNIFVQIKQLHQESVTQNTKTIAEIRCKLWQNANFNNIGQDILEIIKSIEITILSTKPDIMYIVSTSNRVGDLLKQGNDVIPFKTKNECINRLNPCIIYINQHIRYPTHGIILQLNEDRDQHKMLAAIYHVMCNECNRIITVTGSTDGDIFAPPNCPTCKSSNMMQYHIASREEFENLCQPFEQASSAFEKFKKLFKLTYLKHQKQ